MKIIYAAVTVAVAILLISSVAIPAASLADDPKILDVLVIDGQSNAEYGGIDVCDPVELNQEYSEKPAHNILYYGTDSKPAYFWDWSHDLAYSWAAYHLHNAYDYDNDRWKIGGYEPILGNTISKKSGHDVLVVNMAIGATKIAELLPDGGITGVYSWTLLNHALEQANKRYDGLNMVGVVWAQGEGDASTPVNDYKSSFRTLMASFDKYGLDDFYIIKTREYYGGNACTAQAQLAAEYSNVMIATDITETFTIENGMLDDNPIHYSQKGRTAISNAIKNKIVVPEYHGITNQYDVLLGAVITMMFLACAILMVKLYSSRR